MAVSNSDVWFLGAFTDAGVGVGRFGGSFVQCDPEASAGPWRKRAEVRLRVERQVDGDITLESPWHQVQMGTVPAL